MSVFSAMLTDLRLAARSLAKSRGFTLTAVLTLGLGMTLCTTAMVAVNAYLLNGLPYPAADRLHWIRFNAPDQSAMPRGLENLDWASLNDVIEHPIAWDLDVFYMLGGEYPEAIPGAWVTPGFVQGLGIQPEIGRGFDRAAFVEGGPNVALISHHLWTTRFGGDPQVVGRTFTAYVSDRPDEAEGFTIIGVMPERFWHLNIYTEIFAPLRAPTFPYMARLRAGVSPQTLGERVHALLASGAGPLPPGFSVQVPSAHESHVQRIGPLVRAAGGAAALVLFVACANVAGLLLIRAAKRQKEIAVRTALGARRGTIVRMLLAEAMLLGTAVTLVALVATRVLMNAIGTVVEQSIGRAPGGATAFGLDLRVMGFVIAAGVLITLICTLAPLASAFRPWLLATIQGGGRTATDGRRAQRLRSALIAVEIAASLSLIAGSALMVRSVVTLLRTDFGIDAAPVLSGSLTLRNNRYPDAPSRAAVFERILARVGSVPGVTAVGLTTSWPVQQPPMFTVGVNGTTARVAAHAVTPAYFDALKIALLAGRPFAATDRVGSEAVALVSESLARRFWAGRDAIGQRISLGRTQNGPPADPHRIVGIVADVLQDPADSDRADLYVPMLQGPSRSAFAVIRTSGEPSTWAPEVRAAFRDIDPELALNRARPFQAIVDDLTARPRFFAALLTTFALIAAILALVGIYGVIAYAVRQREREIAVRLAVGADPARITRLFVTQGGMVLAIGLGLGVLGAIAAGRLIESQLVGITPRDPLTLAVAVSAFAIAGFASIWWPSRRAARTDPAVALRLE
jgi:putative ABC transport system permease protein